MDFANLKTLTIPQGEVTKITSGSTVLWEAVTYTNQVPISTDTDGSIFNGVGYIENRRLSSSGGLSGSEQTGSVTTGFIPWYGDSTYLRIKGVEWWQAAPNYNGHYYIMFYNANKGVIASTNNRIESPSNDLSHIVTITRDSNGVETIKFNEAYGATNAVLQNVRSASFIRITAHGKGANMIVTINEEI